MNLLPVLEGILFLSGEEGMTSIDIQVLLDIDDKEFDKLINNLKESYNNENRGIQLEYLGNKWKLTTKKEHREYYEKMTNKEVNSNLSPATLEVLAIIAYNQPVTRIKVDEIRGINSSHLVRKLLLKNLIEECGKSDGPGRPNLYRTTDFFLDSFGLKTLDELPQLKEVEISDEEKNLFESKYKETCQ
jgi:segregation and condensation protein B